MAYKILYIEDNDPASIIADLEGTGLEIEYHEPETFEDALLKINNFDPELLLLDFRLSDKKAVFDAPTIAQTLRTMYTENHRAIPIVLISSEENISGFYKDYTSQDLFDFAVSKRVLSENIEKYSRLMKSLSDIYKHRRDSTEDSLINLLNFPDSDKVKLNTRLEEYLHQDEVKNDVYISSSSLLNKVVKPSGVLIGEDIISARLGVTVDSEKWGNVLESLSFYKYSGIYSDVYERWWSVGVDAWWKYDLGQSKPLKRLTSKERCRILEEHFGRGFNLIEKRDYITSDKFWTICKKSKLPLDPIDGFEAKDNREPWMEPEYYSLEGASELPDLSDLKPMEKNRFLDMVKGL